MPLYDYSCTCGWKGEFQLPIAERDCAVCPNCLRTPERLLAAPMGKMAGQVAKGGGADAFTADMLGMRVKDLPPDLRTPQELCNS
jgi:putative FmdB family regulatory protein